MQPPFFDREDFTDSELGVEPPHPDSRWRIAASTLAVVTFVLCTAVVLVYWPQS